MCTANADQELGALAIAGLKRFWTRHTAPPAGAAKHPATSDELRVERLLLAGLKLNIREAYALLADASHSFEDFEAWVLRINGGSIAPERVERLNAAVRGDGTFALETILPEPVLSAADLSFWDENGYVVLKEAVTADACRAAVHAILHYADISMEQPVSWYKSGLWIPLAHHPALWANRNAPRIHTAFAQIYGRQDLWMNVDVCGVNPPLRPGAQFQGTPLHWDMSLVPPVQFGTQAMLYLTDTTADGGAFSCVPGFHRRLAGWLRDLPETADPRAIALKELRPIPIAGRAGDLIIWHQALPHAGTGNRAALPRVVQYMNMFSSEDQINSTWL